MPHDDQCQVRCLHPEEVSRGRSLLEGPDSYEELASLFGALADPTRVRIVHTLLQQELCTCDLAAVVSASESSVSQHLRVLRGLRLIRSRRAGKLMYHRLDDAHVESLVSIGLSHHDHAGPDRSIAAAAAS